MFVELAELARNLRPFPPNEEEIRSSYPACLPFLSSLQLKLVLPDLKTIVPMATPWLLLLATMAVFYNVTKLVQIQNCFLK